jgi:DNA primase
MKFSRRTLQTIRDRVDLVELVNGYTTLQQRGNRWWGLSPFKTEKTPSFTVKPDEGFYYCFATQKGGDLFRFVSEMEGLSFPEAVEFLAQRAGVELEEQATDPDQQERQALYDLYQRVAGTFSWFLQTQQGAHARNYLERRGITAESAETFQIGYAPASRDWLYGFLRSKSYSPEFLAKSGLFASRNPGYPLFNNRLVFPIHDERNHVVAFGGRALAEGERAKYINSPDTLIYTKKRTLYGLPAALPTIRSERKVFLTEGYLDVLAMHQAGILNVLAPLGTALTPEQVRLIKRWVEEVVLVFDSDSAGQAASFRAAILLEEAGLQCAALPMEAGKDPAEIYQSAGADALYEMVETTRPVFDFLLQSAANEMDLSEPGNRELLLRKLFPYIRIVRSEVRREALLDQVSDILQVSPAAVHSDYLGWDGAGGARNVSGGGEYKPERKQRRDLALMLASIQESELFSYLRTAVSTDDLEDPDARRLFVLAEDAFRHEEALPRGVLDRLQDERFRNDVLEQLTSKEYSGWTTDDVDAAMRNIRVRKLEREQRVIESEMKAVPLNESEATRRLLERKMAIDQELSQVKARSDD